MEVPRYPTRETRMSSGPRRSPAPAIPAGRGDGRAVTPPAPGCERAGQARSASMNCAGWAERYGQLRSRRLRQGRPARRRAGRALAGIGLALARGSGDA